MAQQSIKGLYALNRLTEAQLAHMVIVTELALCSKLACARNSVGYFICVNLHHKEILTSFGPKVTKNLRQSPFETRYTYSVLQNRPTKTKGFDRRSKNRRQSPFYRIVSRKTYAK